MTGGARGVERLIVWHRWLPAAREQQGEAERARAWAARVVERATAAGGSILAQLGGTLAVAFDATDLEDAMELALRLSHDADARAASEGLHIAFGFAHGEVEVDAHGTWHGSVLDRAQALANRARSGEIVLDAACRELASGVYLFGRSVAAGPRSLRGHAVDRAHARRHECSRALRLLGPSPLAPVFAEGYQQLRATLSRVEPACVLLRGPEAAGAEDWVEALDADLGPPLLLWASKHPAGLQPLGGLQLALRRRSDQVQQLLPPGTHARAQLQSLLRGEALPRDQTVDFLGELCEAALQHGAPAWIVLQEAQELDPATLEVVCEAATASRVAVLAMVPVDSPVPRPLRRLGSTQDYILPPLKTSDARVIAEAMLGVSRGSEVARRVAVLGGDTPSGVREAVRTLVASGDLIHDGTGFQWRAGPRRGVHALALEALIEERLSGLDLEANRMLEAVCVGARSGPDEWIHEIAAADGLGEARRVEALRRLHAERLVVSHGYLDLASAMLRQVVRRLMPSSRAAELHRFASDAVTRSLQANEPSFARALLGYHLAQGGLETEATRALLDAAQASADAQFHAAAVRLAAAAVQVDDSPTTRAAASRVATLVSHGKTRSLPDKISSLPPAPDGPASEPLPLHEHADTTEVEAKEIEEDVARIASDAVSRAIRGILSREFDTVDRAIDTALAAGKGRAAAHRLRAMAALARGDVADAMQILEQARESAHDSSREALRSEVALALVLLQSGEARASTRIALRALARARTEGDARGEAASLHVFAACLRALEREEDARRVEAVAARVQDEAQEEEPAG